MKLTPRLWVSLCFTLISTGLHATEETALLSTRPDIVDRVVEKAPIEVFPAMRLVCKAWRHAIDTGYPGAYYLAAFKECQQLKGQDVQEALNRLTSGRFVDCVMPTLQLPQDGQRFTGIPPVHALTLMRCGYDRGAAWVFYYCLHSNSSAVWGCVSESDKVSSKNLMDSFFANPQRTLSPIFAEVFNTYLYSLAQREAQDLLCSYLDHLDELPEMLQKSIFSVLENDGNVSHFDGLPEALRRLRTKLYQAALTEGSKCTDRFKEAVYKWFANNDSTRDWRQIPIILNAKVLPAWSVETLGLLYKFSSVTTAERLSFCRQLFVHPDEKVRVFGHCYILKLPELHEEAASALESPDTPVFIYHLIHINRIVKEDNFVIDKTHLTPVLENIKCLKDLILATKPFERGGYVADSNLGQSYKAFVIACIESNRPDLQYWIFQYLLEHRLEKCFSPDWFLVESVKQMIRNEIMGDDPRLFVEKALVGAQGDLFWWLFEHRVRDGLLGIYGNVNREASLKKYCRFLERMHQIRKPHLKS